MGIEQQQVEQAEKTLADLMDQKDELVARAKKLTTDRANLAYSAHTGDKGAADKLRKANDATITFNIELEGIDAAIVEATKRLDIAHRAEAASIDRAQAQQLKQAAAKMVQLGELLDDCWTDMIGAANELRDLVNTIHGLNSSTPNHDQVRVLGVLCMKTGLMQTLWAKEFEHIAPNQRRSFSQTTGSWAATIEQSIAARLPEQPKTETTEAA
jgi:hypothetical protein